MDNRWGVPREGARAQERGEESTRERETGRAREGETVEGETRLDKRWGVPRV